MDEPNSYTDDWIRSLIFRGITRAQMVAYLINHQAENGFTEWMNHYEMDKDKEKKLDQDEEGKKRMEVALMKCEQHLREETIKAKSTIKDVDSLATAITKARSYRNLPEIQELIAQAQKRLVPLVKSSLDSGIRMRNEKTLQGVFDSLGAVPDDQMPEEVKLKKARTVLRTLKEASAIKQMNAALKGTRNDPGTTVPEPRHIEALENAIQAIHNLDFKPKGLDEAKETLYDWKHEFAQHWLNKAKDAGEELSKSKDSGLEQKIESHILRLEVAIGDARELSPPFSNTKLLSAMELELQTLKIPILEERLRTSLNSAELEEVDAPGQ